MDYRYIAVFGDDHVKVYRITGDRPGQQPEALTITEFERRSAANRIVWRPAGERSLVTDVDIYARTIIETRFQLR